MIAKVLNAKISGDGRAVAYVLAREGVGRPPPDEVRTYVRGLS